MPGQHVVERSQWLGYVCSTCGTENVGPRTYFTNLQKFVCYSWGFCESFEISATDHDCGVFPLSTGMEEHGYNSGVPGTASVR
jgi:hypothetical protein